MRPDSALPTLLFYIARPDGSASGPHHAAFLRKGLASGALSPETRVSLKGTEDWLPLSDFMEDLGMPERQRLEPARRGGLPRASPARKFWGSALIVATLALSLAAAMFFHRQSLGAGVAALLVMAGCLAGALMLLDPLKK